MRHSKWLQKTYSFFACKTVSCIFATLAIVAMTLLSGCKKEFNFEEELEDYLFRLPPISADFPAEKESALDSTVVEQDTEYVYHVDYYSVAAGYNDQIVLNPQTDAIFPGALIKGETVLDGSYVLIPAERKPITISTSLLGSGFVSMTIDDPKLSSIRTAINDMMNQEYDVPPANMGFTIEQAYSEQQLKLSLRSSYNSGMFDIAGGFDFENKTIKTRLVAKFIQSYYTLDMDMPNSPAELFNGNIDFDRFGTYMPMYVSTVTYGRMALFTIESELSETEVRSFLEGSYGNLDASYSNEFESLMASSTMKVYVLGGSGNDAAATIDGFEAFKSYIRDGGNFSRQSPGAPISYKLRYITDNTIGKIVFAASYPIRTAFPRTDNMLIDLKVRLYSFHTAVNDPGSACELRGTIVSWHHADKPGTMHQHFSAIDMGLGQLYVFPANTTTERTLTGCLISDTVFVNVAIYEHDDWPNGCDHFDNVTVKFNLSEIVAALPEDEYFECDDITVREIGGGDYVKIKFRFYPAISRIPD